MPDVINENGTWVIQPDVDLSSLQLETIDLTDGTWTLVDPNSGIKTLSFEDDANKVITNAISAGTLNNFGQGTAYNSPRWYRNLTDSNGVQLTTGDNFILLSSIQGVSASNVSGFGFACGTALRPTATGSNASNQGYSFHGLVYEGVGSDGGNPDELQSFALGGSTTNNNIFTSSAALGVFNFGFKHEGAYGVSYSNGINKKIRGFTVANITSSTHPLVLQVGFGTRQNSFLCLDNANHKMKLKFKVIKVG